MCTKCSPNKMYQESINVDQSKQELLKYKIRKFTIQHSIELAKIKRIHSQNLENKLKNLGL